MGEKAKTKAKAKAKTKTNSNTKTTAGQRVVEFGLGPILDVIDKVNGYVDELRYEQAQAAERRLLERQLELEHQGAHESREIVPDTEAEAPGPQRTRASRKELLADRRRLMDQLKQEQNLAIKAQKEAEKWDREIAPHYREQAQGAREVEDYYEPAIRWWDKPGPTAARRGLQTLSAAKTIHDLATRAGTGPAGVIRTVGIHAPNVIWEWKTESARNKRQLASLGPKATRHELANKERHIQNMSSIRNQIREIDKQLRDME